MSEAPKDLTTTSFGLIIAYVVPGLLGLYSMRSWSAELRAAFSSFLTVESNVGLFLLVVVASLGAGLLVNSVRWFVFERWRADRLRPSDFAHLGSSETKLAAFKVGLDENFRYHQFYGGIVVVLPLLCASWLKDHWATVSLRDKLIVVSVVVVLEITATASAMEAYNRYVERTKRILGGE